MKPLRISVDPWAWVGLVLLSLAFLKCNGPAGVAPINSRMTVERHNAEEFPVAHGNEENPSGDCNACHGGLDSFSQFSCLNCHEHEEGSMTSAHSGMNGFKYESGACYDCHPTGDASLDRNAHTEFYFPINTGTNHEDAGCQECHTGSSYGQYSCLECHEHSQTEMDPAHSGVSGYTYESSACLSCHPQGEAMGREDHQEYFPIQSGTAHSSAECAECHTLGTYSAFSCVDCHTHAESTMNSAHTGVQAYVYESSSCLGCHQDGTAMSEQEHNAYFPISSGTHSRYGCSDCHTDPYDYEKFTCIGCHDGAHTCNKMDSKHREEGVSGYACEDDRCYACHPSGRAD